MRCQGNKYYVTQIEKLIKEDGNYLLVSKQPEIPKACYTHYYLVFFHKGAMQKVANKAFPWIHDHVTVLLTYDNRHDAKYSGRVFINLLDYNRLVSKIPEVNKIVWQMRQETKAMEAQYEYIGDIQKKVGH